MSNKENPTTPAAQEFVPPKPDVLAPEDVKPPEEEEEKKDSDEEETPKVKEEVKKPRNTTPKADKKVAPKSTPKADEEAGEDAAEEDGEPTQPHYRMVRNVKYDGEHYEVGMIVDNIEAEGLKLFIKNGFCKKS